jgi:hypothetical protein
MMGMQMRGAMALGLLALSAYALRQPNRRLRLIMGLAAIGVVLTFHQTIFHAVLNLWEKTAAVGVNARDAELAAIWNLQADNPMAFLFGQGWGYLYASPAVGNYWVNYSHSAVGFFFLKTGLVGMGLMLTYGYLLLRPLCRVPITPVLFASLPPLFLAASLYTSYKYLGTGLLLWFITAHAHPDPQPHSPAPQGRNGPPAGGSV